MSFTPRGAGPGPNSRITFSGPFQVDGNKLPNFDLAVGMQESGDLAVLDSGARKVDFGMIATADAGYIEFQGQAYELDQAVFTSLSSAAPFSTLDPTQWLTNPSQAGREEINGAETIHTSGQANVERITADLVRAAEQIGLKPGHLEVRQEFFDRATLDLFQGVDDGILRRLDLRLGWHGQTEDTTPFNVTIDASVTVSDVNENQEIAAPENAAPFSELVPKLPYQLSGLGEFLSGGPGRTKSGASD